MIEQDDLPVDVDIVMKKIRQQIATQRSNQYFNNGVATSATSFEQQLQFIRVSSMAEQHAYIARLDPTFDHYPAPLRLIARIAGKLVLFLCSFITAAQQQFNLSIWQDYRSICNHLDNLEQKINKQQRQINNSINNNIDDSAQTEITAQQRIEQLESNILQLKSQLSLQAEQLARLQEQLISQQRDQQ